jgi:dihydrolipoamide dehydrogenase
MARKEKIIAMQRKGIASMLKKRHVTVEKGFATILPKSDDAFMVQVDDNVIEGKRLLICTGSEAIRLPIPGAEQSFVYTNREILSINTIPDRLVVAGGGVIGIEIATFFAEIGSSVTVIELLDSIGGPIDSEIAALLQKELEQKGIEFKLGARITAIGDRTVIFESGENTETVPADIVLTSIGRRPVTEGFGLESLNVHTEHGAVITDEWGRTGIPGVWASGDVNGKSMLAHTAYRETEVCINDMLGRKDRMRYNAIPGVIYTHPEVASVGYTLDEATKNGFAAKELKLPLAYSARYVAENEGGRGMCKLIVDTRYGTLLGAHMIGGVCSEMIFGAAAMIENELRIDDIKEIVFPHPTVSEIIRDTLRHAV